MLPVEHVYAFSWASAHFQLSICMLKHVHTFSWAYAPLLVSIRMLSLEYVHVFTAFSWAWMCACSHVTLCTLSPERMYIFSVEHLCTFFNPRKCGNSSPRDRITGSGRQRHRSLLQNRTSTIQVGYASPSICIVHFLIPRRRGGTVFVLLNCNATLSLLGGYLL